jgi:hypothetical protein
MPEKIREAQSDNLECRDLGPGGAELFRRVAFNFGVPAVTKKRLPSHSSVNRADVLFEAPGFDLEICAGSDDANVRGPVRRPWRVTGFLEQG